MTTLFISDLHLSAERPDITSLFIHFLNHEAREAEALYILGDLFEVLLPVVRKHPARAMLVKPDEVLTADQEDAAQHHRKHPRGESLGVDEAERAAPGAAEQHPAFDTEKFANALHVGNQGLRVVARELGVRRRATRAALVEQDDAVAFGVEKATVARLRSHAGTAMHEEHRDPFGVAALLEIEFMGRIHREAMGLVRLDLGE